MPRSKQPTVPAAETGMSTNGAVPESAGRPKRKRNPSLKSREIAEVDDVLSTSKRRRSDPPTEKATRGVALEPDTEPRAQPEEEEEEDEEEGEPAKATPRRARGRPSRNAEIAMSDATVPETPSRGPRGRGAEHATTTPSRQDRAGITPRRRKAADRSAKKKSVRALIASVVNNEGSDSEDLARAIYASEDESASDNDDEDGEDGDGPSPGTTTPSKSPAARRRGRPRKQRSPTPPRADLPAHEMYFHHSRPGMGKTSDRTLSSVKLLTHDEYFDFWQAFENPHEGEVAHLTDLHVDSFPQWEFELSQGFSVCLYGMGSKMALLRRFASRIHKSRPPRTDHKIVVVNGYVRAISTRDILAAISAALHPKKPASAQPPLLLETLTSLLSPRQTLTLVVNSIDAPPLRKPATQSFLAQLASHPHVRLVCSADTPDFPLLWDISLRSTLNLVFHDATTLAPLSVELSVVDDVHELLGRAARRAGGLDAVFVVLRSLTSNARRLYGLLIAEVLTAISEGEGGGGGGGVGAGDGDGENPGIEFRTLFGKAVEAFVCPSSEMAFRQLLREFLDHQMITNKKDALGTELISVPFRQEEMEAILEDVES